MKHIYLGMYKQEIVDTDLTFCQGDYGEELVIHGIADSRSARIVFRKPDGNTVERTNLTKDNDVYKYTLQVAELQAIGTVIADVKFTDASSRESSQKFKFTVKPDTINDSVKDSPAWSDSIEQAKTQFAAALVDALTDVENNTAQKIAYANNQLTQLIDTITAACITATENANAVVTQKTGINDSKSSKTETYSSDKIESIASNLQDGIESACNGVDALSKMMTDEYNQANIYAVGDYCIKDNVLYKCKTAITNPEAWTDSHWTATDIGREIKSVNNNLENRFMSGSVATSFDLDFTNSKNTMHYIFTQYEIIAVARYSSSVSAYKMVTSTIRPLTITVDGYKVHMDSPNGSVWLSMISIRA